ncbi:hypothetical protein Avbf_04089 [Armadillidium vulgare]|nr:hypothetical protein Avbf_04089 [Armadillidium vulgare]
MKVYSIKQTTSLVLESFSKKPQKKAPSLFSFMSPFFDRCLDLHGDGVFGGLRPPFHPCQSDFIIL